MKLHCDKIVVSNQVYLKSLSISDSPEFFSLICRNKNYLGHWLPWIYQIRTLKCARDYLNDFEIGIMSKDSIQMGIFVKNLLMGIVGIYHIDQNIQRSEVGYWIDQHMQRKGITYDSIIAFLNTASNQLHINEFYFRTNNLNEASLAMGKKLNLKRSTLLNL